MVHPEVAYAENTQKAGVDGVVETFDPQIIPNDDKHKLLSDRVAVNSDIEMASPVSLALSCFGINKFIPGASHDLRFTIGQQGA
jgi:hypothetical protein